MTINRPWALDRLRDFERGATLQGTPPSGPHARVADRRNTLAPHPLLVDQAHVIETILDRVLPRWRTTCSADPTGRWQQHWEATKRAIAQLQSEEELRENLGDNAPTLDAGRLHHWVWEGAKPMWESEQYSQAVVDALKKVNAEAQRKVSRRDATETDLFNQLFSLDDAKPGRPRLRLMDNDRSDTYGSVHRGARALAEGLFAGVRNPHSHEVADTPAEEQHALEQLAAVSVLARWVDGADVVKAP